MKNGKEGGIDQEDDKRETIDPSDVRHLNEREVEILGVAQVCPRKAGQKKRTEIFEGHPQKGCKKEGRKAHPDLDKSKQKGKGTDKETQVKYEEEENQNARYQRDISVIVNSNNDPVENSEKGDETGQESKFKALP